MASTSPPCYGVSQRRWCPPTSGSTISLATALQRTTTSERCWSRLKRGASSPATSCSTPGTAPWTISRLSAATISAHKWQRPQDRGRRQSLGRGLRDLRMHRYGNLQTTAMMLHARDLVDEVFAEMKREAAEA